MAFDTVESREDEDFYVITLSVRPQGEFSGSPGREQFFVSKEGQLVHRQVLALATGQGRNWALLILGGIGIIVIVGAVIGVVVAFRGRSAGEQNGGSASGPTPVSTGLPVVAPAVNPTSIEAVEAATFTPSPRVEPTSASLQTRDASALPPRITLEVGQGPPGTVILINGTGFSRFSPIRTMTIHGVDVLSSPVLSTDTAGEFPVPTLVPGLAPGSVDIVVDVGGMIACAPFNIALDPELPEYPPRGAAISIGPATARVGE